VHEHGQASNRSTFLKCAGNRSKSEPTGPRMGVGFLVTSHQLESLGKRCKLPQRGPGRSPCRQTVLCVLSVQSGPSRQFTVIYCPCKGRIFSYARHCWSLLVKNNRGGCLNGRYGTANLFSTQWAADTTPVVKVVLWSRGGSPDEARLEQTPYRFQPH